ncbi:acetate/propionate family kinase [Kribbella monticola]|uniref:acetate/propionate family kinase n=1 Tax=Kribbella monticola TaxID=2185285 RepID=UPI000DD3E6C2|nr:acetate/propionate family kinase [Kribbella monticola]
MNLLIVNAGSSSLKLRVLDDEDQVIDEKDVSDWDGSPGPIDAMAGDAVVHRVVHGGDRFDGAAVVDDEVEAAIEDLVSLAPLHQPKALELIRASRSGGRPVVACFDTSYHRTIPDAAATYALPAGWRERFGLRKFGFHGLSHAYVARRAPELLDREVPRLISCHLGSGASLCAIEDGRSVDTTMGFTPLDGLVMGTRPGSVDPGLLLWLQTSGGLAAEEIADALEHSSGLLALSSRSGDLREVLAGVEHGDETCRLAYDVYVHRLVGEIARMAAALGGVDALVFTGGVGEHSAPLRAAVARRLDWLGIVLDAESNESSAPVISAPGAPIALCVIESREDLTMAAQAREVLGSDAS